MYQSGTATDARDLLEQLNTLLVAGLAYADAPGATNHGNGTIGDFAIAAAALRETWTVTFTNAADYGVVGSLTGADSVGTVGTPFSGFSGRASFTIFAGSTAFIAGDKFTFKSLPAWESIVANPGAMLSLSGGAGGTDPGASFEQVIGGWLTPWSAPPWKMDTLPKVLEFTFGSGKTIAEYAIMAWTGDQFYPTAWTFEAWNGSAWVVLDTRASQVFGAGETRTFAIGSPVSTARYRLNFTAAAGSPPNDPLLCAIELHETVGGPDVAMSQYVWKAQGNNGGTPRYLGARAYGVASAGLDALELFSFPRAFDLTLPLRLQLRGATTSLMCSPAHSLPIPYTFTADGDGVAITVAIVGNPFESARISEDAVLASGVNTTGFLARPNAANGIQETYGYLSDVITAWDGSEQRVQLRSRPTQELSCTFTLVDGQTVEDVVAQLMAIGAGVNLFPVWPDATPLTQATHPGDTTIWASVINRRFFAGESAVLWVSQTQYEIVSLAGPLVSYAYLNGWVSGAWPVGTLFIPLVRGRLIEQPQLLRESGSLSEVQATYSAEPV